MPLTEKQLSQAELCLYVRVFEEDHLKGQLSQAHLRQSRIRDAFKINVIFGPACLKKSLRTHSVTPLLTTSD